ncbi:MAG: hypothetical protein RL260_745 [Pseudomonadota bacterium]
MPNRTPLTDAQGEVRELTAADLKAMRPAARALPASLPRCADCACKPGWRRWRPQAVAFASTEAVTGSSNQLQHGLVRLRIEMARHELLSGITNQSPFAPSLAPLTPSTRHSSQTG